MLHLARVIILEELLQRSDTKDETDDNNSVEEETKRITALASAQPKDKSDFDKIVEYAKLELKEAELDTKENIVRLQMQENKNNA